MPDNKELQEQTQASLLNLINDQTQELLTYLHDGRTFTWGIIKELAEAYSMVARSNTDASESVDK